MPQPSEAKTRKELIDPALKRAGWDVVDPNQVGLEIPVDGFDPASWHALQVKLQQIRASGGVTYDLETPKGVSDYALYRPNGEIVAVVEAKHTSNDPRLAQAQAEFYVSEIAKRQSFAPFAFMTNGERIYFLDVGQTVKREVQGFFAPEQRGYILLMGGTERVYVEEYRRRVDQRILDLVDTNPTLQAIGRGEPVSDLALIELERALHGDLGAPGLELSEENIRKAFAIRVGSLLEFLRRLLDLDSLPDYGDIVQRQFSDYIAAHLFNADQIRFLRAVQNIFTRRRDWSGPTCTTRR